jgi:hypothetical protein
VSDKFWSRVEKRGETECWLWRGPRRPSLDGRQMQSPQHAAWVLAGRALPRGLYVSTACRNPDCVNPQHLREGRPLPAIDSAAVRLWRRVDRTGDCWLWTGRVEANGYGKIWANGVRVYVHRLSWVLHHGEIPENGFVCHHCDKPACVRPEHLFLGTQVDNMQDMARKHRGGSQRHPETLERGAARYCAKLDDDAVREIRRRHAAGEGTRSLALAFGVNNGTVYRIVHRQRWKHVE